MSTKTLKDEKRLPKQLMFSQKCLGIVLKRTDKARNCECVSAVKCIDDADEETAVVRRRCSTTSVACAAAVAAAAGDEWMYESGYLIYQEFQEENRQCFWNTTLVDSVSNVEYMGYVAPGTLLICGNEYYLEAVRSAWARRVLRSPANFIITRLGDVTGLEIQVIPQTQFTPLPEALCLVVSELNLDKQTASLDVIFSNLQDRFADMIIPNQEVVYSSLGKLIKDRKVYHTGDGYFIVTPETYHMTTMSSLPERPLLMSNEEAIHKLHGGELLSPSKPSSQTRTRSIQTNMAISDEDIFLSPTVSKTSDRHVSMSKLERTGSLRLSRKEKHRTDDEGKGMFVRSESMRLSPEKNRSLIKDINLKSSPVHREVEKGEKISMFSKLFRRSSSKRRKGSKSPAKYATFSAQFPPLEWSDPDVIHFHSRSTQTLSKESRSLSPSKATLSAAAVSSTSIAINNNTSNNIHHSTNNNNNNHNNIGSSNQHSTHHHLNCNAAISTPPPPPPTSASSPITNAVAAAAVNTTMKCKTDSLTRLRDADKSANHHHHRARSSNRLSGQVTDIKSQTDTVPTTTDRPLSSGLPRRGIYHASSSELSPSNRLLTSSSAVTGVGQRNSYQLASSRSSLSHLISPARLNKPHSSSKDTAKLSGTKLTVADDDSSLHSSAASLNRVDPEAKVKNTDLRNDEEYKLADLPGVSTGFGSDLSLKKATSKYSNRWSVHGASELATRTPMNNVSSRNGGSTNGKQPRIKCVNKLHHSSNQMSAGSGQQNKSPNVTAAIRPTQAIKPLNQYVTPEKVHNADDHHGHPSKLVSSPSFTKSFDLESTDFKSITAHKLLKGISVNSIDTLVEVNLVANEKTQMDQGEPINKVVQLYNDSTGLNATNNKPLAEN